MGLRMGEIVEVQLPDGQKILARVSTGDDPEDIGYLDRVRALAVRNINQLVGAVAGNLRDALDQYGADEVSADFGIELSLQTGQVIGVLAEANATANITVHLTWRKPDSRAGSGG